MHCLIIFITLQKEQVTLRLLKKLLAGQFRLVKLVSMTKGQKVNKGFSKAPGQAYSWVVQRHNTCNDKIEKNLLCKHKPDPFNSTVNISDKENSLRVKSIGLPDMFRNFQRHILNYGLYPKRSIELLLQIRADNLERTIRVDDKAFLTTTYIATQKRVLLNDFFSALLIGRPHTTHTLRTRHS